MTETVLIVRHGPGRGRLQGYCDHVLGWIKRERPETYARIRLHETGSGAVSMEGVSGVFCWLADPLTRYPECLKEALAIESEARESDIPVLNRPSVLASYGKVYQAERFADRGIPSPPACIIRDREDLDRCVADTGLPVVLRRDFSYAQQDISVVRSRRDLSSVTVGDGPRATVATPLLDTRGGAKRTIWARRYHKKRVLLIGDRCVQDSLYFSRSPIVAQDSSLYQDFWNRRAWLRSRGRLGRRAAHLLEKGGRLQEAVAEELRYLDSGLPDVTVFREVGRALDLQFLGIDYAQTPGERPVIWEANPYPFLPSAKQNLMKKRRAADRKVDRVCGTFADCIEALLRA
jgi:hypothetical protein